MTYKLRDDIVLENVCGANILVALRSAWDEHPFAIQISRSSALIWRCVKNCISKEIVIQKLCDEMHYSKETAEKRFDKFVSYCEKYHYFVQDEKL